RGLEIFIHEVRALPVKVYVLVPLTVPQDPTLSPIKPMPPSTYKRFLSLDSVAGLGETVAWTLILDNESYYVERFKLALEAGKLIEGHTAGARDFKLASCICAGVSSCHEAINAEQALERLRLGLFLMIREGSIKRSLPSILPQLIVSNVNLCNVALVTDGVDPIDLMETGYIDNVVREAIEHGLDPVRAIQMVTINPARHFKMDDHIGAIVPGRYADITVIKSLEKPKVLLTICNGHVRAKDGKFIGEVKKYQYPPYVFKTMKVKGKVRPEMLRIQAPINEGPVKSVAARLENETVTRKELVEVNVVNGEVKADEDLDLAKIAVIDRHFRSGRIGLGLIKGFGAKIGAIACSLNFDENQLVVIGYRDVDMASAANAVIDLGGGIAVWHNGRLLEALPMPIAGVISTESLEEVAGKLANINRALRAAGSPFTKPLNAVFFTTFVSLPEIRFTDKGIVDVKNRRYIPLFA
ncbi:MAG: adenine deaminase C-terminal domain-containing protein, partial [Candidatus Bathyarchaeia archaeon]